MARLRVCHIASGDLWAGAEVQVASLLKELTADPDLKISVVLLNKGTLYDLLISSGIDTRVYDEKTSSLFEIIRQLRSFFVEWAPDVVHTHRYKENCLGGLAAACANKPAIVQTVHGIHEALGGWQRLKVGGYSLVDRMITRCLVSGLIGVSMEITTLLKERFPRMNVSCIHNGIQFDESPSTNLNASDRHVLGIDSTAFVIGTVGRLTPVKGLEVLLRAISILVHEEGNCLLRAIIVGAGPLRQNLEQLSRDLGIDKSVLFLGERRDVRGLLECFDIFVLPSLHEGIPIALLEAMAAGRPVIATNVGGIPEVVRNGIDGTLIPARDAVALASAIKNLQSSSTLRQKYQAAVRDRVAKEFNIRLVASRTKAFYRGVTA